MLEHVREGRSNPEIAALLGVSVNTVRTHVSSMLAKTALDGRAQLARWGGEPAPATRAVPSSSPTRSPLLAWLTRPVAGRVAVAGLGVAIAAALLVVVPGALRSAGESETATPTAAATSEGPERFSFIPTPSAIDFVEDGDPAGGGQSFLYEVATGRLLRVAGAFGGRAVSPFGNHALGIEVEGDERYIVLLDFDAESATRLFEGDLVGVQWTGPSTARVLLDFLGSGTDWPSGLYELNLAADEAIVLVRTTPPRNQWISPSLRYVANLERQLDQDDPSGPGEWQVIVRDLEQATRLVAHRETESGNQPWLGWSQSTDDLTVFTGDGRVLVFAPPFDSPTEVLNDAAVRGAIWSADGEHLALSGQPAGPDSIASWVVDRDGTRAAGPFDGAVPLGWSPDGTTLLMMTRMCEPAGFRLATFDVGGSSPREIPIEQRRFWYTSWSPDGSIVLAGLGSEVYLIDPESGATERLRQFGTPEPRSRVSNFPYGLNWTGTGEWIFGPPDGGRGRCE